jgi:Cytochrome bd terminal oxidase subunit II
MAEIPIMFILAGLAAYTVLAGADFGAGLWTLLAGPGRAGRAASRDHARHAMGPVWEANHVWLIFVLVVCWTAYLFRLFLRGRLDPAVTPDATVLNPPPISQKVKTRLLSALASAALVIGTGVTVFADPGWARAVGIVCLFACAIFTFGLATAELDETT